MTSDYDDYESSGNDLDLWELQWVIVHPPYSKALRLERCRRQDLTNTMSKRLGFPGASALSLASHELLWGIYEVTSDAYELHNLRPDEARRYLEEAFYAGRFAELELAAIARDRGMDGYRFSTTIDTVRDDFERVLVAKLAGATKALLYQLVGERSRGQRRRRAS